MAARSTGHSERTMRLTDENARPSADRMASEGSACHDLQVETAS